MAVDHKVSIGYFDTLTNAKANNLSNFDEIVTSGYGVKTDGGGAHYKRYTLGTAPPPKGFEASQGGLNKTYWALIPDGGVINPLQAGAKADGTNDRDALQACIEFIKYWNVTNHQATYTTTGGDSVIDADTSRNAVKLVIPANRVFVVNRRSGDVDAGVGLDLNGPITIEGEDRFSSIIRLKENSTGSNSGPVENDPVSGSFGVDNSLSYSTNGGTDQDKGDTTSLNIIVRGNVICDLLDTKVDPDQNQPTGAHRAIDIEMLQTAPNPVVTPGWPDADGAVMRRLHR